MVTQEPIPSYSDGCAIYVRISRDLSGEGAGVERQEAECRQLAQRHLWNVSTTFSDNDVSASTGVVRPGYQALLRAIDEGTVRHLVIWHPDRLHRSPKELESFIDLVERRSTTIDTVSAGAYDLTTPSGRMVARVVGAMARYEGEQKSQRMRSARIQAARDGKPAPMNSRRCFGYSADGLSLVDSEAAIVRQVAADLLSGQPMMTVLAWLRAQGVTTTLGGSWKLTPLVQLLTNPRLAGYRVLYGQRYEGSWPTILTIPEHNALVAMLTKPKALRVSGVTPKTALLPGIAICGHCGAKLQTVTNTVSKQSKRYSAKVYACKTTGNNVGCGKISITRASAEDVVKNYVIDAAVSAPNHEQARQRLEALEDAYYVQGTLSQERFETLSQSLRALAEPSALDDALKGVERTTEALEAAWASKPLSWRRAFVLALIDKVTINKATKSGRGSKALDRMVIHCH